MGGTTEGEPKTDVDPVPNDGDTTDPDNEAELTARPVAGLNAWLVVGSIGSPVKGSIWSPVLGSVARPGKGPFDDPVLKVDG